MSENKDKKIHLGGGLPFFSTTDRDEYILIEALGTWIPMCDVIFYGLINSRYSEDFYKLRHISTFNPTDIYYSLCYFNEIDLVRYLASTDSTLARMDYKLITRYVRYARMNYRYMPAPQETMMRHALIEAAFYNLIKKIVLVYPFKVREVDKWFLDEMLPKPVREKIVYINASMRVAPKIKPPDVPYYTTIILNSKQDLKYLIDNSEEKEVDNATFLLLNNSENTTFTKYLNPEDPSKFEVDYIEEDTKEIVDKLMIGEVIPKTKMRFARFYPFLYNDLKPREELPQSVY